MEEQFAMADRFTGLLLGTALGDSLGLPLEGITRSRLERWCPLPLRQRLLPGWGMVSDDTDHAYLIARSLLACEDIPAFSRRMAWYLRLWLLSLPAGIGLATARAIIKLWLGFSPAGSGVFSAGNGPAMRSPLIGAFFYDDPDKRRDCVKASTELTHTDPRAQVGALAVAEVAAWVMREGMAKPPAAIELITLLRSLAPEDPEWQALVAHLRDACDRGLSVPEFADLLGQKTGVSGYIYHTVPVVIYGWWRHCGDFSATLAAVISCGGDADTTGAIAGALAGLTCGEAALPAEPIAGLLEFPRSVDLLRKTARALARKKQGLEQVESLFYLWPLLPVRNVLQLFIVLLHGFRRLLPPY
jgi:ADP-ribosylglycohydrolase